MPVIADPVIAGPDAKRNANARHRPAARQAEELQAVISAIERFEAFAGNSQTQPARRERTLGRESRPVVADLDLELVGLTFGSDSYLAAIGQLCNAMLHSVIHQRLEQQVRNRCI